MNSTCLYMKLELWRVKDLIISGTNLNLSLYSIAAMHFCLTIPYNPSLTYANCTGKKFGNPVRLALRKRRETCYYLNLN